MSRHAEIRDRCFRDPVATLATLLVLAAGLCSIALLVTWEVEFLQCTLAFLVTAIPFGIAARTAPGSVFHPLVFAGVTALLGVAGQTAYIAFLAAPDERSFLLSGIGDAGLSEAVVITGGGLLAMGAGFLVAGRFLRREPGPLMRRAVDAGLGDPDRTRLTVVVAALLAIAAIAFAIYAPKVGIDGVGDLLTSKKRFVQVGDAASPLGGYRSLIRLAGVAMILAAYGLARLGGPIRSGLGLLGLAAFAFAAITSFAVGSRGDVLIPTAMAGLVYLVVKDREPRTRTLVALGAIGLVVVTLLGALRLDGMRQDEDFGDALAGTSWGLEEPLSSRSWMSIGPLAAVYARVPEEYPYQKGSTLVSALVSPIPRSVWPSKPEVRFGRELGAPVFGFDERRISGDPPGLPGELWVNGGLVVLLIGMALFGVVLRWIERIGMLSASTGGLAAILFGCLAIQLGLRQPASDLTESMLQFTTVAPPLLLGLWLARNRSGREVPAVAGGDQASSSTG